ncbi:MAG: hypothetical protein EOP09_08305 [Proteobacteria bacterium]|nr:MAG: hypothetical protein EOP09_08305 [Pseudomonadota bacterium]
MGLFQPYPDKRARKLLELSVTYRTEVLLWVPGGKYRCIGRVMSYANAADQTMLTILKDKIFHETIEAEGIKELFMKMQVEKELIYFKSDLGSGDEMSWNFSISSLLYKLERRAAFRIEIPITMANPCDVSLKVPKRSIATKGIPYDLSQGGISLMMKPSEVAGRVPDGIEGQVRFEFGTLIIESKFRVTNSRTLQHRKHGVRHVLGAEWIDLDPAIAAEIGTFIAKKTGL